jgi:hypothetical protein
VSKVIKEKAMYIGARILKTGLAVTLAMLICQVLKIEPAVFAAISVVVNMQSSVGKALKNAWEQLGVHILAVTLAVTVGYLLGTGPLVIGLTVIAVIVLCNRLGWSGAISLGVVTIVFILDSPPDQFLRHAATRSLAVFIGLGVALGVNRVLAPPRYKDKLSQEVILLFQETSSYFLESLHTFIHSGNFNLFRKKEPKELKIKLIETEELLEHAREELTPLDNPIFTERMMEISRGFVERGQSINEMTSSRVKRRHAPDSPISSEGVSPEFQGVLDILSVGEANLDQLGRKLLIGLKDKHSFGVFEEDTEYWEQFDAVIDEWQKKVSGVFYLRALMEVAVVATEMRWASRRMKTLHNLLQKQNTPSKKE